MDKIVHFEMPVDNVERAQKFYQDTFGWRVIPMPEMQYTIVHTGPTNEQDGMVKEPGFINGGMFKRDQIRKYPVVTIDVKSIDESVKQIKANGGKMVGEKLPVGDMGYTAYFIDSEGNLVGLWENTKK